jgi:hypothetical protein
MKNLDRLKKQNVRSSEPRTSMTSLSLENLRKIAGGGIYSHTIAGNVCIGQAP